MTTQSICNDDCDEEKRDMHILISFCILFFIGIIILFFLPSKSTVEEPNFILII